MVNKAVKFRESFRPFAPAVLVEYAKDFFEMPDENEVPFMEKVYFFKESKMQEVEAVVHYDGSGRIQTVCPKTNLKFYSLIKHFYE